MGAGPWRKSRGGGWLPTGPSPNLGLAGMDQLTSFQRSNCSLLLPHGNPGQGMTSIGLWAGYTLTPHPNFGLGWGRAFPGRLGNGKHAAASRSPGPGHLCSTPST